MNRKMRALVADDHPSLRDLLKCLLETQEVEVCTAVDGADALAKATTMAFDMIFMDIGMPIMNGLTAVKLIREHEVAARLPRAIIVMVSAYGDPANVEASRRAGADRHVLKPFSIDDFMQRRFGADLAAPVGRMAQA